MNPAAIKTSICLTCERNPRFCVCPKPQQNHSACRSCRADITWVVTSSGKKMPVDGHVQANEYEPGAHISHWSTCPDADKFRAPRIDDGGGPGKRIPLEQIQPRPLNLNFGEQPEHIKELLARPRQAPPASIQRLVKQVYALSRRLLARGWSKEELQALSYKVCGLSSAQHLHCCGARPLSELIERLTEMTFEKI